MPKQKEAVTADTHFGHAGITKGQSHWTDKSGCRDFNTAEEMSLQLIENINNMLGEDDILYHLGDFSFGGFDNIKKYRDMIKCKNIHLILGNHDHHILRNKNRIQDSFTTVNQQIEVKIGGRWFVLSHFPLAVWNHHHRGRPHLHGHCHGNLSIPGYYDRKVIDVGVDCHPEFRPFHIDEIISIIDSKSISKVDHH